MKHNTLAEKLITGEAVARHHPYPRFVLTPEMWVDVAHDLGESLDMLGLWADGEQVHMALFEPSSDMFAVASVTVKNNQYPAISQFHLPAMRFERTIQDLFSIEAKGLPDGRPWLKHDDDNPYQFLPVEGEGLHEIPVGPVHAGIIEPGHFRFTAFGETVVRLEERLGYAHKGVEKLLEGRDIDGAAKLCARISGDSTVAYSTGFARAVEAALEVDIPERAQWLRALMAELERLANHFGDIGAICNDAAFALMHAHTAILREDVLQAADECFGHRLMMDRVIPGGVSSDLSPAGVDLLRRLLAALNGRFNQLAKGYDNNVSIKNRTSGAGILTADLARHYAAGGVIGRASARCFDARKLFPCPPYDRLEFSVPTVKAGDVNARIWIRIQDVWQSLSLIEQILNKIPAGDIHSDLPQPSDGECEGMSMVEGFRGDILTWVKLAKDGTIIRCHPRDPSWFQWPLLEAVIEKNIVADFPLCNKSFNCSYSGHDL